MDYVILYKNIKDKKPYTKANPTEIQSLTKFIAKLPKERYLNEVLQGLLSSSSEVIAADGTGVPSRQLGGLLACITKLTSSKWIEYGKAQRLHPNLSCAVPIVLYAHKLHNGTKYEEWVDLDQEWLGLHFRGLAMWRADNIGLEYDSATLRGDCLHNNAVTSHLYRNSEFNAIFNSAPRCAKYMMLQSWLLATEIRTDSMIQDPFNWDATTETIDDRESWEYLL